MTAPEVAQVNRPGKRTMITDTSTISALSLMTCLPSWPMVHPTMGTNRHSPHRGLHRPTAWHMMMATMEV